MIIRGHRPADSYALIPRPFLEDGTLSFKARGLLACILAMQDGHQTSIERLVKAGTDGERAIKSGLKELEDAGYLSRDGEWNLTTDGATVEDGVETPTPHPSPDGLARPADAPTHWMPSDQAIRNARRSCEYMDWELYIMRYLVRCKERKTQPDSGEWLRWLLEEEQKARILDKQQAQQTAHTERWWDTA